MFAAGYLIVVALRALFDENRLRDASMSQQIGVSLHGVFSLADHAAESAFLTAFRAFYGHLSELGFVSGYRIARRQPLDGFGDKLPRFDYHVEIAFASSAHDQACYDYVKKDEEPVRSLHRAMNSQVRRGSADFFLTAPLVSSAGG
jgi:hypothetical protein